MGFLYKELPKGCYKVVLESEIYRLKPKKRMLYEDNRELRYGMGYFVWSRYARGFYLREIEQTTLDEDLIYYLKRGWLYFYPDEECQEEIREEVGKAGVGYKTLMERRQHEIMAERREKGVTGDGDVYWREYHRKMINKLKIKKR